MKIKLNYVNKAKKTDEELKTDKKSRKYSIAKTYNKSKKVKEEKESVFSKVFKRSNKKATKQPKSGEYKKGLFNNKKFKLAIGVIVLGTALWKTGIAGFPAENQNGEQNMQKASITGTVGNAEANTKEYKGTQLREQFMRQDGTNFVGYVMACEGTPNIVENVKSWTDDGRVNHLIFSCGVGFDAKGTLQHDNPPPKTAMKELEKRGIDRGIMVSAHDNGGNSADIAHNVMTAYKKQSIQSLVQYAVKNNFTSINIDFECIGGKKYPDDDKNLVQFIKELKAEAAKNNIYVTIAVQMRWDNGINRVFDYKGLAENADMVFIMCYDQPGVKNFGPPARLETVQNTMKFMKNTVPKENWNKFIMGIGTHVRKFHENKTFAELKTGYELEGYIDYRNTNADPNDNIDEKAIIDPETGTPLLYTYNSADKENVYYQYENSESIKLKAEEKTGGLGFWTIGQTSLSTLDAVLDINEGKEPTPRKPVPIGPPEETTPQKEERSIGQKVLDLIGVSEKINKVEKTWYEGKQKGVQTDINSLQNENQEYQKKIDEINKEQAASDEYVNKVKTGIKEKIKKIEDVFSFKF